MMRSNIPNPRTAAGHDMVNRTQRIVHQRAVSIQQRRNRMRSLWAPLLICSALMTMVFFAVWKMLAEYDLTPTGVPDANYQVTFIVLWCLPVTAGVVGLIWFQRSRGRGGDEVR